MEFMGFYDVMRENLNMYRGEYERIVDHAPDLFRLICELLAEADLDRMERLKLCAVLGYLVAPNDVIPEEIYGPNGYIDDVYLCSHILHELAGRRGYGYLEEYWHGDEELEDVVVECLERSSEILGDDRWAVLGYAGLE
ncbi:YkvA family protein [Methanothermobacter wolfeii]|uniref:YkvA family protein n=1 Tax=Methanothermobacter wolfeii TaxID=145261 RepID=UPI0024B38EA2|nr:YkvA family protein [Methanothermobacter wolfeii]MDI6701569.1 YkvA family protein [Methanothermobacter wolfeii]